MANKVLKMTFENSKGKKTNLTLQSPKEGLTEDVVKGAMQKIVDANIFEKEEISLYKKVVGAKYYITDSQAIFDDSKTADAE